MFRTVLFFLISLASECFSSWASPTTLSTPMVNASEPRIGSDNNGNLVAAWIEGGTVLANTCPYGGSWGQAATISNMGASSLQLNVNPNGLATAIWVENGTIASASCPSGGSWSVETIISGLGTASAPQIAVDPAGNAIAVWVESGSVLSKTQLAGGGWPLLSDTLAASGDSPQIAINASLSAVAVWHSVVNSIDTILTATKTIGGFWSVSTAISSVLYRSQYPKIAIDASGNILAAWYRYNLSGSKYSAVVLQGAYYFVNRSWDAPVDLSDPSIINPANLSMSVAFNGKGIGLVLWTESPDGSNFEVLGKALTGNGWLESNLFIRPNLYAYANAFAVNTQGFSYAAFMLLDPESGDIEIQTHEVNTYAASSNRVHFGTISTGSMNGYPKIATSFVSTLNQIGAVWLNFDGMYTNVQSAIGTSTPVPAPTNLSVTQNSVNQGLFTDYVNTVSWSMPSDTTGITGYILYRNGQQISSGPLIVTSFDDHNQNQNGSVSYGVAFIINTGSQSLVSMITWP